MPAFPSSSALDVLTLGLASTVAVEKSASSALLSTLASPSVCDALDLDALVGIGFFTAGFTLTGFAVASANRLYAINP